MDKEKYGLHPNFRIAEFVAFVLCAISVICIIFVAILARR